MKYTQHTAMTVLAYRNDKLETIKNVDPDSKVVKSNDPIAIKVSIKTQDGKWVGNIMGYTKSFVVQQAHRNFQNGDELDDIDYATIIRKEIDRIKANFVKKHIKSQCKFTLKMQSVDVIPAQLNYELQEVC